MLGKTEEERTETSLRLACILNKIDSRYRGLPQILYDLLTETYMLYIFTGYVNGGFYHGGMYE